MSIVRLPGEKPMTTLAESEQFVIKKSVLMTDKSLPPEVKPGCYIKTFLLKLSDHDAQLLTVSKDYSYIPTHRSKTIKKINKYTVSDFIDKLSCESWDSIFNSEDVNAMFNSFLNIYLRIFHSSFPLKKSN